MNREVIFRGKRLDNGKWLYGDLMHDNHQGCYIYPNDCTGLYTENKVDPDTVGEFTGMRDRHGKKVFEGDVVRRRDSAFGYVDTGVVKYDFHLGAFVLEYESYGRTYQSTFKKGFSDNDGKCTIEETYSYEVIGNIHNNPEFVNKDDNNC